MAAKPPPQRSTMHVFLAHLRAQWMGALALLLVVTGGTAYAADTIFSTDIVDGEVKTPDLASNVVGTGKIGNNQVFPEDVRDDTLPDGGLRSVDLAAGSVGSSEVSDGSIGSAELGAASVGSSEIATGAVGTAEVADASLTGTDVATGSLGGSDVGDSSLTGTDILPSSLTGSDVAADSLSGADIADTSTVGGLEINESSLDISGLVFARDDGPDTNECEGALNGFEVCADVFVTITHPSRVFVIATGAWGKLKDGEPGASTCRLAVNDVVEVDMSMGEHEGTGGHQKPSFLLPFTLSTTTGVLNPGSYDFELQCNGVFNGFNGQQEEIYHQHISAVALAD